MNLEKLPTTGNRVEILPALRQAFAPWLAEYMALLARCCDDAPYVLQQRHDGNSANQVARGRARRRVQSFTHPSLDMNGPRMSE